MTADVADSTNPTRTPLKVSRLYTTPGVHPYDEVTWEHRDVVQTNWKTGETVFEQTGVEFPDFWSVNASSIVTTKYFRGAAGSLSRESSLRQLIDRVVGRYVDAARDNDYFASEEDVQIFSDELTWMLLHQVFAFNSPVWFNVGTASPQQVSACFILSVDDSMDSILNWYREEGLIFKGGSGSGLNISRIRSSQELLSSGGNASGPVSFMRGADASAGTIKSGGATRRAAKMVVMDIDHPDIVEFIDTKVREEEKIRALRDAGFDMDLGGKDIFSVQYQNANNSVRVSDEFMQAVADGTEFALRSRTDGQPLASVDARDLFAQMSQAAWACADPGIQYDTTINDWHTTPSAGRINASNPCSEYMHLDNSSCNLASLNLLKFLSDDGTFDVGAFTRAVEIVITAMDISICFADFPTDPIGETTRNYRQLGIGYANLGALLMAVGLPYDSAQGRTLAGAITSLMTAVSYRRSAQMAGAVGPYNGFEQDREGHLRVMSKHAQAGANLAAITSGLAGAGVLADLTAKLDLAQSIATAASSEWELGMEIGRVDGWRNAQASVLAPTGTIGFMMDCDTTGIEPDFSLVKFKKLVGGGSMQIVNQTIPMALQRLGYAPEDVDAIVAYIAEHGHVVDAPGLAAEHYAIFDTAMGVRPIDPMGHINMMAACQPFLSGAISKTVNMPEDATVDEVADIYFQGWRLGLKAIAVYRDNCKVGQPLSDAKAGKADEAASASEVATAAAAPVVPVPVRRRLPARRRATTTSFNIGDLEGYLMAGEYEDGTLGEVFIKVSKQGSTLSGIMDGLALAVSVALQYGVPLETFVTKYVNSRFEPSGMTSDADIRMTGSILDFVFRRLAIDYLDAETRQSFGIYTTAERVASVQSGSYGAAPAAPAQARAEAPKAAEPAPVEPKAALKEFRIEAPMCFTCGTNAFMKPAGACFACTSCGSTSGCS